MSSTHDEKDPNPKEEKIYFVKVSPSRIINTTIVARFAVKYCRTKDDRDSDLYRMISDIIRFILPNFKSVPANNIYDQAWDLATQLILSPFTDREFDDLVLRLTGLESHTSVSNWMYEQQLNSKK